MLNDSPSFRVGDLVEFVGLKNFPRGGVPPRSKFRPKLGEIGLVALIPDQYWQSGWVDIIFPSTGLIHIKVEELSHVKAMIYAAE